MRLVFFFLLIFDQVLASYLWFCFPSFFATLSYPTSLQLSFSKSTNVAQEPYLHHQSKRASRVWKGWHIVPATPCVPLSLTVHCFLPSSSLLLLLFYICVNFIFSHLWIFCTGLSQLILLSFPFSFSACFHHFSFGSA